MTNYTIKEINHIIYNNRSTDGVIKNFMPKLEINDLNLLLKIGNQMKFINKLIPKSSSINIYEKELDLNSPDIEIFPKQLENIKISSRNFSDIELKLIQKKNIPNYIIDQYDISPLSQFKDIEILNILGVTTHPILKRLLGDGISDGLIIPLYNDGKLINTAFRKTNELYDSLDNHIPAKLNGNKYGLSVPELNLWGDEILEGDEIWLCEGLFDMMAIRDQNKKCVSASSCNLNDFQYFQIIKNKPRLINIFVDNDTSGYKSALKSQKIFGLNGIKSKVFSSKKAKDAGEHFFELSLDWNLVEEIRIKAEMLTEKSKTIFYI